MSAMIPVAEAVERMLERVTRVVQTEIVPLAQGLGRICAKPIQSPIDVPGHDNSAMDGYAVRAGSTQVGDQPVIVGTSAAGHPYSGAVAAGQCVRIMTGATVPTGTDAIIIQENVSSDCLLIFIISCILAFILFSSSSPFNFFQSSCWLHNDACCDQYSHHPSCHHRDSHHRVEILCRSY